jgi:CHAT domain
VAAEPKPRLAWVDRMVFAAPTRLLRRPLCQSSIIPTGQQFLVGYAALWYLLNLALGTPETSQDDPLHTKPRQPYLAFAAEAGDPTAIRLIDLGPAEPIEQAIAALRAHVTSPAHGATPTQCVADPGEALRQLLVDPLHDLLPTGTQLVVIADGDIGPIPLHVLPSGEERRLIDHLIIYISSPREIPRWNSEASRRPPSLR